MIAMTTSNSISVNAGGKLNCFRGIWSRAHRRLAALALGWWIRMTRTRYNMRLRVASAQALQIADNVVFSIICGIANTVQIWMGVRLSSLSVGDCCRASWCAGDVQASSQLIWVRFENWRLSG